MFVAVWPVWLPDVRRGCSINRLVAVPSSLPAAILFLLGRGAEYPSCGHLSNASRLTLVFEVFQNACGNNNWVSGGLEQCFS